MNGSDRSIDDLLPHTMVDVRQPPKAPVSNGAMTNLRQMEMQAAKTNIGFGPTDMEFPKLVVNKSNISSHKSAMDENISSSRGSDKEDLTINLNDGIASARTIKNHPKDIKRMNFEPSSQQENIGDSNVAINGVAPIKNIK